MKVGSSDGESCRVVVVSDGKPWQTLTTEVHRDEFQEALSGVQSHTTQNSCFKGARVGVRILWRSIYFGNLLNVVQVPQEHLLKIIGLLGLSSPISTYFQKLSTSPFGQWCHPKIVKKIVASE